MPSPAPGGSMISIVIPAYCAGQTLAGVYDGITSSLNREYEIIFVDDGSTDDTAALLRRLCGQDGRVKAIILSKNHGQQEATLCGLEHAHGDYIATMDADGQHPPALINDMMGALQKDGLDIVYAVPKDRTSSRAVGGGMRNLLFYLLFPASRGIRLSSYRIMTQRLARYVLDSRRGFNYFSAMVFSSPVKAASLYFPYLPAAGGNSSYTLLKRLRLFIRIFLHYGPLSGLFRKHPAGGYAVKELIGFG